MSEKAIGTSDAGAEAPATGAAGAEAPEAPATEAGTAAPETAAPPAESQAPETSETPEAPETAAPEASVRVEVRAPETAAPRLNVFQRAAAMLGDRKSMRAAVTEAGARAETLQAQLDAANAEIAKLQGLETEVEDFREKVETLEGEAMTVRGELEGIGVPEDKAPAAVDLDDTPAGLLDRFNGMKGAEAIAFYRANEAALNAAQKAQTANG